MMASIHCTQLTLNWQRYINNIDRIQTGFKKV